VVGWSSHCADVEAVIRTTTTRMNLAVMETSEKVEKFKVQREEVK
jgi:hypothetical protein